MADDLGKLVMKCPSFFLHGDNIGYSKAILASFVFKGRGDIEVQETKGTCPRIIWKGKTYSGDQEIISSFLSQGNSLDMLNFFRRLDDIKSLPIFSPLEVVYETEGRKGCPVIRHLLGYTMARAGGLIVHKDFDLYRDAEGKSIFPYFAMHTYHDENDYSSMIKIPVKDIRTVNVLVQKESFSNPYHEEQRGWVSTGASTLRIPKKK